MKTEMPRRDFLKAAPLAAYAIAQIARGETISTPASFIISREYEEMRVVNLKAIGRAVRA
jgi:hypothetical protein